MASIGKILGITTAVAASGIGIYYLVSKAAEVDTLLNNVNFNVSVSKVTFGNKFLGVIPTTMTVYLNVQIINPTTLSISFKKPDVWIYYGDKVLASSKISEQKVKLEPQGTTTIRDIAMQIPLATNASIFVDMAKRVFSNLDRSSEQSIWKQITGNALTLMPLLKVKLLTYIGKSPLNFEAQLA